MTTLHHDVLDTSLPADDPRVTGWVQAVRNGFHDATGSAEQVATTWRDYAAEDAIVRGVWSDSSAPALSSAVPVATFMSIDRSLNAGAAVLPATLITDVTVRPTHRRRGLLRSLMIDDLRASKERGLALSLLTASEATIYGRFGFGVATHVNKVEVSTRRDRWGLRTRVSGRCELAEVSELGPVARRLFEQVHARTRGSVERPGWYDQWSAGWDYDENATGKKMRAVVHYSDAGDLDGFCLYHHKGWDEPTTLQVRDLIATTDASYLALWDFLGNVDLAERVIRPWAPLDDPLEWALTDPRAYQVAKRDDLLWVRVLDVPAALAARSWGADGRFTLQVHDALGHAEGCFDVEVREGRADVRSSASEPDLVLDVEALGSLYLGAPQLSTLVGAGRATCAKPEVGKVVDLPGQPYCFTGF